MAEFDTFGPKDINEELEGRIQTLTNQARMNREQAAHFDEERKNALRWAYHQETLADNYASLLETLQNAPDHGDGAAE